MTYATAEPEERYKIAATARTKLPVVRSILDQHPDEQAGGESGEDGDPGAGQGEAAQGQGAQQRRPEGHPGRRGPPRAPLQVGTDQQADGVTAEQIRIIDDVLARSGAGEREWGICTECGMGRATREEVPTLLDLHRTILEGAR